MAHKFSNHGRSGGSQTHYRAENLAAGSVTMADRAVLKRVGLALLDLLRSVTMADRAVLKRKARNNYYLASSVTMADRAVLKPVGVDMPFDLGISISKNCKICQVFLFLRPARSFFRSGSRISASVYSRPDGGMDPL